MRRYLGVRGCTSVRDVGQEQWDKAGEPMHHGDPIQGQHGGGSLSVLLCMLR